jgi:hypothetical protein
MDRDLVCLRHVGGDEIHPSVLKLGEEGDITRQAVELGYENSAVRNPGQMQSLREFRALVILSAFDFGEDTHDGAARRYTEMFDSGLLRFKS